MNKNEAMIEYLRQYPDIQSFLYFNHSEDEAGNTSIATSYGEAWEKRYVGGHGIKTYDFALVMFQPQDDGTNKNNAQAMYDVQKYMDWIDAQNKARNFPNFEGRKVLSIENLQNAPNFAGTNESGDVAKYMFQCRVRYYE